MLRRRERPQLKSPAELQVMREAGRMVAEVLTHLATLVAPGVSTGDLNEAALAKMDELGAERPSFLGYHGYPAAICASVDDEVVHGIPGRCDFKGRQTPDRALREGELLSLDCGVVFEGYHGDSAVTVAVGEVAPERAALLDVCREALWAGIRAVRPGAKLTDVARSIEQSVRARPHRYGIVEDYVGHGIGRNLHEAPHVPNVLTYHLRRNDLVLEPGLTIAIEPMVCLGSKRTRTLARDGWTVVTKDGRPAAHFEHTLAVTEDGFEILTARADGGTTH
ncbi:MAG: type I methionyl aminopeptidase [Planctomycetota bacterium]